MSFQDTTGLLPSLFCVDKSINIGVLPAHITRSRLLPAKPKYCLIALLVCCSCLALANDKIVVNASVWTGNSMQPWAESIVIRDDRILAVGGDDLVKHYPEASAIDAKGRLVLPGFIDNRRAIASRGMGWRASTKEMDRCLYSI
jgi:hypothetical protein